MRTNTIDTTDVSFHGVRSVGCFQMTFFQPGQLIQGFQQGFHCVKQSGFQGPDVSSVSRNSDLQ